MKRLRNSRFNLILNPVIRLLYIVRVLWDFLLVLEAAALRSEGGRFPGAAGCSGQHDVIHGGVATWMWRF